jgi:hypothetical protein
MFGTVLFVPINHERRDYSRRSKLVSVNLPTKNPSCVVFAVVKGRLIYVSHGTAPVF